jgi:uncharacterized membrane protein
MLYCGFTFFFRNPTERFCDTLEHKSGRLVYLDWMRGLAALIMLQGHVIDSWVRPHDRTGEWFWLSQFLGGLPAPTFLFLVGVSLAIVLDRMRANGAPSMALARKVVKRGSWILLLAYIFRFEQFLVWYPHSQWRDLLKVDTLNCIGISTLIVGLLSAPIKTRRANIIVMSAVTSAFVLLTPWLYPIKRLPPFILSYVNGDAHPSYFSMFPWAAFAFAGIAFGYILIDGRERMGEREFFTRVAVGGICMYAAGAAMSMTDIFEYGFFDYSLTSPHFFLVRLGWLLLIIYGAYLWTTRRSAGKWSPLVVFGQASLIVYWIHMEIVYGRPLHNFAQSLSLSSTALQLTWLLPLMLLFAFAPRIQAALPKLSEKFAEAYINPLISHQPGD